MHNILENYIDYFIDNNIELTREQVYSLCEKAKSTNKRLYDIAANPEHEEKTGRLYGSAYNPHNTEKSSGKRGGAKYFADIQANIKELKTTGTLDGEKLSDSDKDIALKELRKEAKGSQGGVNIVATGKDLRTQKEDKLANKQPGSVLAKQEEKKFKEFDKNMSDSNKKLVFDSNGAHFENIDNINQGSTGVQGKQSSAGAQSSTSSTGSSNQTNNNKKENNNNLKTAGKIAGGVALAAGAAYGGKKLYDYYKKKKLEKEVQGK